MIVKNNYPICEFDTSKNPIIQAKNFLKKTLPEKCVVTFFRKELEQFVSENNLPVIGYLNSEVLDMGCNGCRSWEDFRSPYSSNRPAT